MSLRDQLLKSGVVSQKDVRRVNQEQQAERNKAKGQRERREEQEARAALAAQQAKEAREAELIASRRARAREDELQELRRRVSNLIRDYQTRTRGGNQPFWCRAADGLHLHRLYVNERVAWDLRDGRLGVAWTGDPADPSYVFLPAAVVARIQELEPARVLFFNPTGAPKDDPSEQLYGAS